MLLDFNEFMRAGILKISDVVNLQRNFRLVDLSNFFEMMEVWGTQIDIDIRKSLNVGSFISKQYSEESSDPELDDGVDSDEDQDAAKAASRSRKSLRRSSRNTHRSFLEALGTRIPSLAEQRRLNQIKIAQLSQRLSHLIFELETTEKDQTNSQHSNSNISNSVELTTLQYKIRSLDRLVKNIDSYLGRKKRDMDDRPNTPTEVQSCGRILLQEKVVSDRHLIYESIHEPSVAHVGHVVELGGGHTREFSWREEARLNAHLICAGFGDGEVSSQALSNMYNSRSGH